MQGHPECMPFLRLAKIKSLCFLKKSGCVFVKSNSYSVELAILHLLHSNTICVIFIYTPLKYDYYVYYQKDSDCTFASYRNAMHPATLYNNTIQTKRQDKP